MKKTSILILTLISLIMVSCGRQNTDRLLKTIPKNTQNLAMINGESLVSNLGPEGAAELERLLSNSPKNSSVLMAKYIFSGNDNVELGVPVCVFEFNNARIVTFALKDGEKFRGDIEEKFNTGFDKEKDIWYLSDNTLFISGDQAWLCGPYPEVKPEEINAFTNLPHSSSMAANQYAVEMTGHDSDAAVLTDLNAIFQSSLNVTAALWLNMAFESPRYVAAYVNFEKGKIEGYVNILNDKYEPAAFSMRPSKIDMGTLRKLPGKGNLFVATAFDSSTLSKIAGQLGSVMTLPSELVEVLESIDGTMAMSSYISSASRQPEQMSAMVTFKNADAASSCVSFLSQLLRGSGEEMNCYSEGKCMFITTNGVNGVSIGEFAKNFDGASMGLVFDTSELEGSDREFSNAVKEIMLKLIDKGDSSTLQFTVSTKEGKNSLLTLLEFLNSSR